VATERSTSALLKRHLVEKVPVSDLCNQEELQPSVFYQWQRQLFENLAAAFTTPASEGPSKREKELAAKTKELEAKLVKKDHVIAEVAAELVATKKELGEP
jgi:transposase-like protein